MSFFAEVNEDAVTVAPAAAATGARAGFLRAFETSYQQQVRGASMFGIQEAMRNREDRQRQALRDAGVENIPSISQQADDPLRMFTDFGNDYYDAAEFYEQGGDPEIGVRLREYDKRVEDLKKRFPQLQLETSIDMWRGVKREAQQFETRAATERQDIGGVIGSFLGGAVGGLNPNTDPLNFASLPVGGAGKSAVSRIAIQAGAQGLVETGNQIFGVQDQRRLLGLGYGVGDAAMRIGAAALGGAAVQGFGEAVGYGFRKIFRGDPKVPDVKLPEPQRLPPPAREGVVPADPPTMAATYIERPQAYYDFINEVNPMRQTRAGKARMIDDLTYVEKHLDSWDGPAPYAVPPKMDTAPPRSLSEFTKIPNLQDVAFKADIDALARRVDPETFVKYDKLVEQKKVSSVVDPAAKEEVIRAITSRQDAPLSPAAQAVYDAMPAEARRPDTAEQWLDSNEPAIVTPVDAKLSELSPLIERAYARAKDEWGLSAAERIAVVEMVTAGNQRANFTGDADALVEAAITRQGIEDAIPVLAQRPVDMKPDADAADVQMRVYDERDKAVADQAEVIANDARKLIKQAEAYDELDAAGKRAATEARAPGELPPDQFKLPGYDEPMSLNDRIEVMNEDTGAIEEISVRELLQRQVDTDEDLKAVSSCSIR